MGLKRDTRHLVWRSAFPHLPGYETSPLRRRRPRYRCALFYAGRPCGRARRWCGMTALRNPAWRPTFSHGAPPLEYLLKQRHMLTVLVATVLSYFGISASVAMHRVDRAVAGEGDAEILAYAAPAQSVETRTHRASWLVR